MDVELRHLRSLVAVVDEGSFTDAAIALDVSQATVSRTIAALEEVVGERLLARTSRTLELTAAGERLLPHARAVLRQVEALVSALDEGSRELRVGFAWGAFGRHTLDVQRRWGASTGDELVFSQSMDRFAGLLDGSVQVAVWRWHMADERFDTALLGVEDRFVAMAKSDPLARRRRLTVGDLAGRTVAMDRVTGSTTGELWAVDAPPARERSVRGVDAWLTLIATGQAVGVTAGATVDRHPRGDIVYRPLRDVPPSPVWLAWPTGEPPPGVEELVRIAREAYASAAG